MWESHASIEADALCVWRCHVDILPDLKDGASARESVVSAAIKTSTYAVDVIDFDSSDEAEALGSNEVQIEFYGYGEVSSEDVAEPAEIAAIKD